MDHKPEGSKFTCSICSFTTETSLELLSHLTTHIYEKLEYVCPHCDFISSYRDIVVDHMKIHEQDSEFLIDEVLNEGVDDTFADITKGMKDVRNRGRLAKPSKEIKIETDLEEDKRKKIKPVKNQSKRPKLEEKTSEELVKEIELVKKRGCPPKSEAQEKIRKQNKPVKINCRLPMTEQIKTETLEEIREVIKPSKRRGRPPKLTGIEKDEFQNDMEPKIKQEVKPLKPRNLQTETEEEHYAKEIKPLRKPGRPPKAKALKPETQEETAHEIKPVKKRGRPPKHLKPETQGETAHEIKPVKKRGRPPKHLKPETQEETAHEIKPVKKRGRPPKHLKPETHEKTKTEENLNVLQKIECQHPEASKRKKALAKRRGSPKMYESQVLSLSEKIKTDTEEIINNLTAVPVKPKRVRNSGPFFCSVCEKHFRTRQTLKNHTKLHSVNQLKCSKCHFICEKKKIMRLHMKVHAGQKFCCEQCAEVFPTRKMKRQHLKKNHADILFPFFCRECGYSCNNMFSIKKHIRRYHPREGKQKQVVTAKYSCPHCVYSTHNKTHHTIHMRTHTGERPYQCTACSYRATQSSALKSHMMRLHPEQTDFNSTNRQASFSSSSNLDDDSKDHGDSDTKALWCDTCGKSFLSKHNLFRHKRLHSLGHTCDLCNKIFFYSKAFISHLKRHDAAMENIEMDDNRKSPTNGIMSLKASMFESDESLPGILGEAEVNVQTKISFSSSKSSKVVKALKNNSESLSDTKPIGAKRQSLVESSSDTLVSPNKETSVYNEMKSSEKPSGKTKRGKGLKKIKPNVLDEEMTQTDNPGAHKKDFDSDRLCVSDHKLIEEKLEVVDHALSTFLQVLKRKLQTSGAGSANSNFSGSSKN